MSDTQQVIYNFMQQIGLWGILFSIFLNIIFSFLPIPSFPITYINIVSYGLIGGFFVSLAGEAAAAIVSFIVFRKGLQKISRKELERFPKFLKLIDADKKDAFNMVLIFRMFPYVPSGIITYLASISIIDLVPFAIASTLGKIPAMIVEVLLVFGATQLPLKQLLAVFAIILVIIVLKHNIKRVNKETKEEEELNKEEKDILKEIDEKNNKVEINEINNKIN